MVETVIAAPSAPPIIEYPVLTIVVLTQLLGNSVNFPSVSTFLYSMSYILVPSFHAFFRCSKKSTFIPLYTSTCFPFCCAEIAKLCLAATCHVVAADTELNELTAIRAALPAVLTSKADDLESCFVIFAWDEFWMC